MSSTQNLESIYSEIKNFVFFKDFSQEQFMKLCEGGSIVISKHREVLFRHGDNADHFGLVLSGAYKLSRPTPSGEDSVLYFSTTGDVVGAFIMNHPSPVYPVTTTAMGTSRFLKIPRSTFLTAWKENNTLLIEIQKSLSTRMIGMQMQKSFSGTSIPQRIAVLLIELSGKKQNKNLLIKEVPLPLTRKEIADTLDVTVESIIRVMSQWSKKDIIASDDNSIKINDFNFLKNLADGQAN